MMSDAEFDRFTVELSELIMKNDFELTETRKARDISIMSAPVEKN